MSKHPCIAGPDGAPCRNFRLGEAYDISRDCRPCWLFAHDVRYNLAWGGDGKVTCAPSAPVSSNAQAAPKRLLLGDAVETVLSKIGITKDEVAEWLGGPCGCTERQRRLNDLHSWAEQTAHQAASIARGLLAKLMGKAA